MPIMTKSLALRIASALVLMPIVLVCLIRGSTPFIVMMSFALAISLYEWFRMARLSKTPALDGILGFSYIILCIASFYSLRAHYIDGAALTLCVVLCVWASDTGAYFTGKLIGGPKMAPEISPNKTWSGLFGGMAASALALIAYYLYIGKWLTIGLMIDMTALQNLEIPLVAAIGAAMGAVGQVGDLFISMQKRKVGVKDTGNLIPGHGGLLDRIDALLLVSAAFLVCVKAVH